jgi:CelD/BcsL family acetyltransferase involved in cellulose biosynthesis
MFASAQTAAWRTPIVAGLDTKAEARYAASPERKKQRLADLGRARFFRARTIFDFYNDALKNAAQHAMASRVAIALTITPRDVTVKFSLPLP